MSRPIKYRAWDEKRKEYVKIVGVIDANTIITYDEEGRYKEAKVVVEQYTGLTDKNGKEIYEADIIKCHSQDTNPVGRVMYLAEWCAYEIVSYDPEDCRVYNLESFSPTVNGYLEVIGNVHENKELLGDE